MRSLVGNGSIQERLASAAGALSILNKPEDLPERLREAFKSIKHDLTKEEDTEGVGTIKATTRKLTEDQGRDIAYRIFDIYIDLRGGI